MATFLKDHVVPFAPGEIETISHQLNITLRLPEFWDLERRTVEKGAAP